ncbi:Haloacid dehalogenase-like hydrolase-domain-containing protein [Aspergillus novoparasiticus]|uniref:Haloacid dehalogenase-like hydrolase-domain-containing protein n=1 Tax=Aspergillus novoparasiticus TaxID=986946 RepID=A0A5N6F896_9EURO|nr:Haloacid dehalogenase-like hydrolase-domain-containing protein [Aspergillus novoparasiticus]
MTRWKSSQYKAIIFDLGSVISTWDLPEDTVISAQIFKRMLISQTWSDYERGKLNENSCYQGLAENFGIDSADIAHAVRQARESLVTDTAIMNIISEIRAGASHIAIFAMSNISQPDYAALLLDHREMCSFDRVFPSGCYGTRKPELSFYNKVLQEIDTPPEKVIFVDDQLENVISAQSIGIHGIVYTDAAELGRQLRNLIFDPVDRGRGFLRRNAGQLHSITETNQIVRENFSQLLILEATGDKSLVSFEYHQKSWNFFQGNPILTTETFPDDVGTTSLALMTLPTDTKTANLLLDEISGLVNADGIVTTYFDQTRERIDPVVCVNVLRLFCTYGQSIALPLTLQWVYDVLAHRAYLNGTRYYTSPESFLYFVGQLCRFSTGVLALRPLETLLIDRLKERLQVKADPLSLAMRILTCLSVGVSQIEVDLRELLAMQCEDGSWEPCPFTRYGLSKVSIGNRGLTTAFAVKAVEMCRGN